jgi:hypothetical protein
MQKISRRCGTVGSGAIGSRQRSVLMWSRLCKVGPTTKTRGPRCCVVECFFRVESVDSAGPSLDCFAQKATDNPGQLKSIVMFWPALQRLSILQWSALWHFFGPCILRRGVVHSQIRCTDFISSKKSLDFLLFLIFADLIPQKIFSI